MDDTYSDFSGTELDQDAEFDSEFDWEDEGEGDLLPILGLSVGVAAVVGAILVLAGRRRKKTPMDRVEEFVGDVGKQGKKTAKKVASTIGDVRLADLLSEAMDKAGETAAGVDLAGFASDVKKRARKLTKDVDLGAMLEDALDQAKRAGKRLDLDDRTKGARKKAKDAKKTLEEAFSAVPKPDVDTKGVESFLEALKEKLDSAIDTVRSDIAPKAAERIREDVVPAAQEAAAAVAHTVRDDVMPAVEKRAGKILADVEIDKRARRVASTAGEGAKSFADFARALAASVMHRVIEDVLPEVTKAGGKVVETTRHDVIPAAGRAAGKAAGKVGEVASQTPGALSGLLASARDQAEAALEKAGPVAGDAAEFSRHRLSDLIEYTRHRAHDLADGLDGGRDGGGRVASTVGRGVGGAASAVGRGVGGAASSVGHGVTGAVSAVGHGVTGAASAVGHGARTAASATTYAARESVGILFWLGALGGLILMVFISDKERQKEIVNGILQFFNELREMWTDLQGPDYAPENVEESNSSTS